MPAYGRARGRSTPRSSFFCPEASQSLSRKEQAMRHEPSKSPRAIASYLTAALAAATVGSLTAAAPAALAQEIKDGGTLRAALTGEPDSLDPATSSIYTGAQVYENIFSKLVDIDASRKFVP